MASNPYLGSIFAFGGGFAPRGYALCQGQLLSITTNTALFSILGTTYGGNGVNNFALPDLRGRTMLGFGTGPGLSAYAQGQTGGTETFTLTISQLPAHTHLPAATTGAETTNNPTNAVPTTGGVYTTGAPTTSMAPTSAVGGNQPVDNRQPYLAINYIIALQGIFPSRN